MTPYVNTILALAETQLETLRALDTDGTFACLPEGCCDAYDTESYTAWFIATTALIQYLVSGGTLPAWDNVCCQPVCGELPGVSTGIPSPDAVPTASAAGTFAESEIYRGTGTLAAGTATIVAPWVTAGTVIVASYTTASAAGQANISVGTITPATNFVINGEGTNTFSWIAIVPS